MIRIGLLALLTCQAAPSQAQIVPATCASLLWVMESISGYRVSPLSEAELAGNCNLQTVRLKRADAPEVMVERLRLSGTEDEGGLRSIAVDMSGLRLIAGLSDSDMDDRVRSIFRLQSADLSLQASAEAGGALTIRDVRLALSGGSELVVTAEIAGAELSASSLMAGRLTRLRVDWKSDGHTLRPVIEALGARLDPGATGTKAVLVARSALLGLVHAMPPGSLPDDASDALSESIAALPQGRGRLVLELQADSGIGAAQLGLLALSKDPAGPEALARFLAGTRIAVSWTPGLVP